MTLLASAPTLDAIRASIARFYCGESKTLIPTGDHAWKLVDTSTGEPIDGVYVTRTPSGRVFFMAEPAQLAPYAEEMTPEGPQLVIPGCERQAIDKRSPNQLNLFA